ncbi:hypothetical protein DNC80_14265 [Flavobacterium sp. SOK18b]|uniref:hypothetical protein n=1 Tax=Flavobacterium sp. SOK18b TaxID=797900 RepID=UPI0015F8C1F3|nr:hypothetical protein [Flavobacterium sp. SOK18b]MBB1194831.1 hypothetical protein [Flavobacterium sp. SOK18b]
MTVSELIKKIDDYSTAIECISVLIEEHDQEILKPMLIHLKQEKQKAAQNLTTAKLNIDVHFEIVNHS